MDKIIITKEEIKACKSQALKLSENCYYYCAKRDSLYNELLSRKSNREEISFDLSGGDLMYDDRVPNVHPKTKEKVYKEDGFSSLEYSNLTGEPVPNQWYGNLIDVDVQTGKVYSFEQNGNVSINIGAPTFSQKYKHLIQTLWIKCGIEVELV